MERVRFYLIFSILGIFFAENCSRSSPDGMYNPIIFALLRTVYGTHYLLLGSILFRKGRYKDRRKVYLSGALLGLYEFRITKVFFEPGNTNLFGVNLFDVIRIGFFRHAVMSFLIPFYLAIRITIGLDKSIAYLLKYRLIPLAAAHYAIIGALNRASIVNMLMLAILPRIYITPLIPKRPLEPSRLVLNEKYAFALLLFFYTLYGLFRRTDMLPRNPLAYIIALGFYVLALYPLVKFEPIERLKLGDNRPGYKDFARFYAYFAIASIVMFTIGAISYTLVLAIFIIDVLLMISAALYILYKIFFIKTRIEHRLQKRIQLQA